VEDTIALATNQYVPSLYLYWLRGYGFSRFCREIEISTLCFMAWVARVVPLDEVMTIVSLRDPLTMFCSSTSGRSSEIVEGEGR
jgi:hypothetical protein